MRHVLTGDVILGLPTERVCTLLVPKRTTMETLQVPLKLPAGEGVRVAMVVRYAFSCMS